MTDPERELLATTLPKLMPFEDITYNARTNDWTHWVHGAPVRHYPTLAELIEARKL